MTQTTNKRRALKEHLCTDLLCSDCRAEVAELEKENARLRAGMEKVRKVKVGTLERHRIAGSTLVDVRVIDKRLSEALSIAGIEE